MAPSMGEGRVPRTGLHTGEEAPEVTSSSGSKGLSIPEAV